MTLKFTHLAYGLLLSVCCMHGLAAQITLETADFGPSIDTTMLYMRAGGMATYIPEPSVEAQTWDFSTLLQDEGQVTANLLLPGNANFGTAFPQATYCMEAHSALNFYIRASADSLQQLGLAGDAQSLIGISLPVQATFDQPLVMATLPATVGQQHWQHTGFDARQAVSYMLIDSARVKRTVKRSNHIDAYGTLTLPGQTPVECLRAVSADTTIDSIWVHTLGLPPFVEGAWHSGYSIAGVDIPAEIRDTTLTITWWAHDRMTFLLQLSTNTAHEVTGLRYLTGTAPLARAAATQQPPIEIYPNPARTHLQLGTGAPAAGTVLLLDAQGRSVRSMPFRQGQALSLDGITPGLYMAQVQNMQGQVLQLTRIAILTP